MDIDKFKEGKEKIEAGWAEDRIIENTDNKIVLQCENGSYLIYQFIEPIGIPDIDTIFANKVLFQHTESLNNKPFRNIGKEIAGARKITDASINEAINEFRLRVQWGGILI